MEQVQKLFFKCKKCESPLDCVEELDLMDPPTDDIKHEELSDIIIPVSGDNKHEIIEVPPKLWLEDVELNPSVKIHEKIMIADRLFSYLSGNSEMDHPMCQECANLAIKEQEALLKQSEEDLACISNFMNLWEKEKPQNEKNSDFDKTIEELKENEDKLLKELKQLEQEDESLDKEIEKQKKKLQKAGQQYDAIIKEYNNKKCLIYNLEDENKSLNQRKKYLSTLSDRLKQTNILDILFPISFEDNFGTINGLRMGRLPELNIEWAEINAALGQCLMLLHTIVRKMDMTLENYKLVPCGNASWIEGLKDKKKYSLFQVPTILFSNRSLDQAMVAFLDCLRQVMQKIESFDTAFRFPYRVMDKSRLSDADNNSYSIKLSSNSDENWTKALKFMLINLNWMKAWLIKNSFKEYCESLKNNTY